MQAAQLPTSARTHPFKMRVEGMDCSACAVKIENALKRLPGVSDINVDYGSETLALTLDEDRTSRKTVEDKIRTLGYTPWATSGAGPEATQEPGRPLDRAWWHTRKGRVVIGCAALVAAAFTVAWLAPGLAFWAYLAATAIGVAPIARRALSGALSGTPFSIEALMTVAAAGSVAIGAVEEAAVVIFLFAVGELLENVAAGHARAGIKALMALVPRMARMEDAGTGQSREVPVEELRVGDLVVVRPGDRVPSDGEVIDGDSEVDEAPVTGESVPLAKSTGSALYAGSINGNGLLRVRITKTAADNTIARIIHLVEEAQAAKAPTARFIDRFAAYYTPAAMIVSGLVRS